MVKGWWPLLPYNSEKPFMGTLEVPVTNCSRRERCSLFSRYTTWGGGGDKSGDGGGCGDGKKNGDGEKDYGNAI